jgi:hypothetical protein
MQEKLVNETKILEGTDAPVYTPMDLGIPKLTEQEFYEKFGMKNELSTVEESKGEWKNDCLNGFLTIDLTPGSTLVSSNSDAIADLFNRDCPMAQSNRRSSRSSTNSCTGKSDDVGSVTDAMNECSVCTVPMISELTDGTPSEEK